MNNYGWKVDENWIDLQTRAQHEKPSCFVKVTKLKWRRKLNFNWNEYKGWIQGKKEI